MLTTTGCRERQQRLRRALAEQKIDAAMISDAKEIYYFTGLLLPTMPFALPGLLWIDTQSTWLIAPANKGEGAVDDLLTYEWHTGFTTNPDCLRRINVLAADRLRGLSAPRIGWQAESLPRLLGATVDAAVHPDEWIAIDDLINWMQRRKDSDEIDLIRRSIEIDLAAYRAAQAVIQPGAPVSGVRELDVLMAAQQAATLAAGEAVYHSGDYRSGESGGPARDRQIVAGELYIIDAWTYYHEYWSDLSRTFSVGAEITPLQQSIFDHIKGIHDRIPGMLQPGIDGSIVWHWLDGMIREHPALAEVGLAHHGGHGVGLRAHELPDLNPDRGGMLEVGSVISVEPGAYLDALRGGIRLENMYLITEHGAENLSVYPMSLI